MGIRINTFDFQPQQEALHKKIYRKGVSDE